MPLSAPAARRHYHTRNVECRGYFREDGLWDIEGRITDVKTYDFDTTDRGEVTAGTPVHEMQVRLTIDDDMVIRGAEAVTEHAPFSICGAIAPSYEQLVGLHIGPGFRKAVYSRLGGTAGCTHITELLFPMATAAYQTAYASRAKAREDAGLPPDPPEQPTDRKPAHLDSCHALNSDGPVVRDHWPAFYTGADAAPSTGGGA